MKALKYIIAVGSIAAFSQAALADADFSLNLARVRGTLQCAFSKADGGNFDCSVHVKGQGAVAVAMNAEHDKAGNIVGFAGVDRVTEGTMNYTLAVGMDDQKQIHGVSLITDNMDGSSNSFSANVAAAETTTVKAANISPIAVTFPDENSVTVDLTFAVYGMPTDKIYSGTDANGLTQMLVSKVRPYVMSLMK